MLDFSLCSNVQFTLSCIGFQLLFRFKIEYCISKFYKDRRRRRRGWAEGIDQVKQTFFYSIIRITLACLSTSILHSLCCCLPLRRTCCTNNKHSAAKNTQVHYENGKKSWRKEEKQHYRKEQLR